ncbi:MAG: glycosyltransferase family 4 protein [Nitrospirota bacterium]
MPYLEEAAIQCSVRPLLGRTYFKLLEIRTAPLRIFGKAAYTAVRFLKRAWDLASVGRPDLVVVEGQLFPYCPSWGERLLAWMGHKLVIEFDDAIYLTRFHKRKMPKLLKLSVAAIVGNRTLAEYARRFSSSVSVIPTVVDTERFGPARLSKINTSDRLESPITIVWIGLAYNFSYLEVLVPAMQMVQRELHARFLVISSRRPDLAGVDVDFRPWELRTEVGLLQGCQIGIMPLPDSEWTRGKCGLKLLQYMALGIPAIASPIGVNRKIITSGENGLLATTPSEWCCHLLRLCRDEGLRRRLGETARRTVEEQYALKVWGPRLAKEYLAMADHTGPLAVGRALRQSLNR